MDPGVSRLFPWWAVAEDADEDAPRRRAQAWLSGPYARSAAKAQLYNDAAEQEVLDVLTDFLRTHQVAAWADPTQMEAWLRGLLDGCAASVGRHHQH